MDKNDRIADAKLKRQLIDRILTVFKVGQSGAYILLLICYCRAVKKLVNSSSKQL